MSLSDPPNCIIEHDQKRKKKYKGKYVAWKSHMLNKLLKEM